jgi:hypothetical protein
MAEDVVVTVNEETADVAETNELSPMELELAKKHDVKFEDKSVEKTAEKTAEKTSEKQVDTKKDEPSDIPLEDLDSFEKLHDLYQAKPDAFYKLPKNIKQLYHSQKGLYKKMKDEEDKRKKYEDEIGLNKIQNSVAKIKLDRIKARLANPEGLTVEEMQELIDEKKEIQDDNKPLTKKDLEEFEGKKKAEAEKVRDEESAKVSARNEKIKNTEAYAIENLSDLTANKYDNFDDVVELAKEVMSKKARYASTFTQALNGDANEQEIAEIIVDIARLNPKWGESAKPESAKMEKNVNESVDKLVKNATKQQTSATLAGGRGAREIHISEDMDPEEAAKVWDKIPREIRHKILKKVY